RPRTKPSPRYPRKTTPSSTNMCGAKPGLLRASPTTKKETRTMFDNVIGSVGGDASITALDAVLRADLYSFVCKTFGTVSPGDRFLQNWHIRAICYELDQVMHGETKRLIITMPPRYLKSICASVANHLRLLRPGSRHQARQRLPRGDDFAVV